MARLGQPVRVEREQRPRRERRVGGFGIAFAAQAERQTRRRKLAHLTLRTAHQRRGMAGRSVREARSDRIVDADERGHEPVGTLAAQRAVGRVQDRERIRMNLRGAADRLAHRDHLDRGGEAAAGDVADREEDAAVEQPQRVVPVAADLGLRLAGTVDRIEAEAGDVGQGGGQRGRLERDRHAIRLLEAPAQLGLGALLRRDIGADAEPANDRRTVLREERRRAREKPGVGAVARAQPQFDFEDAAAAGARSPRGAKRFDIVGVDRGFEPARGERGTRKSRIREPRGVEVAAHPVAVPRPDELRNRFRDRDGVALACDRAAAPHAAHVGRGRAHQHAPIVLDERHHGHERRHEQARVEEKRVRRNVVAQHRVEPHEERRGDGGEHEREPQPEHPPDQEERHELERRGVQLWKGDLDRHDRDRDDEGERDAIHANGLRCRRRHAHGCRHPRCYGTSTSARPRSSAARTSRSISAS